VSPPDQDRIRIPRNSCAPLGLKRLSSERGIGLRQQSMRAMKNLLRRCARCALIQVGVSPLLVACASGGSPGSQPSPEGLRDESRPSLVVYLVVDQLRGDLLERYSPAFTGGFRRLLDEGLSFSNALHGHSSTETAPGHAALSTGVHPARAGIPSNAWREGEGRQVDRILNVLDSRERLLGVRGVPGTSPRVLRRTGLADWFLEANPGARVLSVSAKDRAAVLMAGKSKGDVYWFDALSGQFVTSTYYRSALPSWLLRFNKVAMRGYRADSVWASTVPAEFAALSAPDTASFEGDGTHTFFPHRYHRERIDPDTDDFFLWFETTPMLDRATLDLALMAMDEEGIGKRPGRTDFLTISFSQTDRVGHVYGPLSREQMDNLLRLDRVLGDLFAFLDRVVGPERYVVGLTGDHGVMTMPERLEVPGLRLTSSDRSRLEQGLSRTTWESSERGQADPAGALVEVLGEFSFVGPAFTHAELLAGVPGDSMALFFQRSFTPGRAGGVLSSYGVEMWWAENVVDWTYASSGTTHGSPFYYDRWVPLILMGPGIERGRVETPVQALDLTPTLAVLGGVPFPEDLDGVPLIRHRE
jgi:predicted AlkP superfamily pyrophosphatase or phosphodiesterase